ncbi:MAG: sulfotransferase [Parvularculaceae bacterium]
MQGDNKITGSLREAQADISAGRFDAAMDRISQILAEDGGNIDALYMRAVAERYLKRYEAARESLGKLKKLAPDLGRAHQEEGHLARDCGDTPRALNAYRRARQSNPALVASWRAEADILAAQGAAAEANMARSQEKRLAEMSGELLSVLNFIHEGRLLKAETLCRHFLKTNPHHVEAMRLLADIGVRLGILDDAEFLLESAVQFEPENIQLRLDYIAVLRKRQKFKKALDEARSLYEGEPENPIFQSHYAIENLQAGEIEKAISLFDKVLDKIPDDTATLVSRGHALKTAGRTDEAINSYRSAANSRAACGEAFFGLANLKTFSFDDADVDAMERALARDDLSYNERLNFHFALAKALEDKAAYETAFENYARGNAMKRSKSRYDADKMTKELQAQIGACTIGLFEKFKGSGCVAPDPIFIVGLPRAGSTLLEQILASHSMVDGTLELPNILSLAQSLRGANKMAGESAYPQILHDTAPETFLRMGEAYIRDTAIHRAGAPFFIDKMPNNFRHLGLILLILPNAKIIDARREPMACCFSGFKQLFAEGQEFTYGLKEIGQYYRDYVALMRHWDAVLPGSILRVQHEDLLDDLEGELRRILAFCDLPFEESCLQFHRNDRSVRTASSEQVRQPLNKRGVDQWRPFEPFLSPLEDALGPARTEYRT